MCRASIPFYKTNMKKVYRQYRALRYRGEHGCLYNTLVHLQDDQMSNTLYNEIENCYLPFTHYVAPTNINRESRIFDVATRSTKQQRGNSTRLSTCSVFSAFQSLVYCP